MKPLLILAAFIVPAYLVLALAAAWELRPSARARRRLAELRGPSAAPEEPPRERPTLRDLLAAVLERLRPGGRRGGEAVRVQGRRPGRAPGAGSRLAKGLWRAGLRLRPEEFIAIQVAAAVAGAAFGATLLSPFLGAPLGGILGWTLPSMYVERRVQQRRRQFAAQLPDALTIAANALRSGYSFLQAADVVASEMPDPISSEFAQVVRETRVNIALEDALANLLDRMESRDLDLVITAVLIQQSIGGNLAEILDTIAETIRDRVRIQGQIRTLTAQGRMSGWIIGALPVAIVLVLMAINPGYILTLFRHPVGLGMVAVAVLGEILGALAIRQIVQVEV